MEEWVNSIANIGFPIFITVYLLVCLEAVMDKVMDSFDELKQT